MLRETDRKPGSDSLSRDNVRRMRKHCFLGDLHHDRRMATDSVSVAAAPYSRRQLSPSTMSSRFLTFGIEDAVRGRDAFEAMSFIRDCTIDCKIKSLSLQDQGIATRRQFEIRIPAFDFVHFGIVLEGSCPVGK